jgi:hypothetical protein
MHNQRISQLPSMIKESDNHKAVLVHGAVRQAVKTLVLTTIFTARYWQLPAALPVIA